eukprot:TRINITY_DN858_c0_g1_i1.p2 TRINITY_DN858_c0_g1~~TRINITY_DN858_c0_g1_i1.p2  ORF type:complete len:171 (-),score=103.93 TRINITY_DN858_c0_g1_i1:134-625(-)
MADKPFSVDDFTTQQLALFKEAFDIFAQQVDKKGDKITFKELPNVLRSCGILVSFSDLDAIAKDLGTTNFFDFSDFLALAARSNKPQMNEEVLVAAFRRFDPSGKGSIPVAEFRHAMGALGDILSNEELDQFIKEADQGGAINYRDYAKRLLIEAADSKPGVK